MRCIDKQGKPFEVIKYSSKDCASLESMYVNFYPKGICQGMPPLKDDAIRRWIRGLLENGENLLARQDGKTVGHLVVLPDFKKGDAEYLIFVSHPNRERGIGSELTRTVIQEVKNLGLTLIWLTVGVTNFRAIGLYKKFGFIFSNSDLCETERKMILLL